MNSPEFCIWTLFVLISFATSDGTQLWDQVDILTSANEELVLRLGELENRLEHLEDGVSDHRQMSRRQHIGHTAFSYRIDTTKRTLDRNDPIVFPVKITDLDGGYNSQTGIYTAPVDGVYMLSCSLLADQSSASIPQLHASIMVDGKAVGKVFAYADTASHRDQGASTIFVHLKQGSMVWVKVIDLDHVTVGGDMYSMFSGYLLFEY
ncbi:hypothetical protein ACF0H5_008343 [Mactra antiquata]